MTDTDKNHLEHILQVNKGLIRRTRDVLASKESYALSEPVKRLLAKKLHYLLDEIKLINEYLD